MFVIKKKQNEIIDFLAYFSVIAECATTAQMDLFLAELNTRSLKIANRFLGKKTALSNCIPSSKSTNN